MIAPESLPRLRRPPGPRPGRGVVHLGLGAFFRAHGAIYLAEAMQGSGGDWVVTGVSLRSPGQRDRLAPQDCAYTAVELGPDGETTRIVDVVAEVLVAPEDPAAVLDRLADPATRLVTLTVTEKGYCHDPATGRLNPDHPDIVHDLAHPDAPRSAPGFLVAGLARRRAAGLRPFTIASCDNLPANGALIRGVTLDLAGRLDPTLAAWIAAEARFPSSMVDRIVPATRPEDVARLAARTGVLDAAPVLHEPFRQWVIEDAFVDGARPDLAAAGVELVADVAPYEHMKLRLLNGAHSALAYLGGLAGLDTIAETVADPAFAGFLRGFWNETLPGLTPPPGVDLAAYVGALAVRFANPAIRHRLAQIAMDGSQKLPQRLLAPLAENLAAGRPTGRQTLALAAWMRFVAGRDDAGRPLPLDDPLADRLRAAVAAAPDPAGQAAALLALDEVFPPDLAARADLRAAVAAAAATLASHGARAAAARLG